MAIDFQVISSFMKNGTWGNVNGTLIITIYDRNSGTLYMQIIHKIYESLKLTSGGCKGFILSFWWESQDNKLFLWSQWNKWSTKKETLVWKWSLSVYASCPISIWESSQLQSRVSKEKNASRWTCFKIFKNFASSIEVSYCRNWQELAQLLCTEIYVRSCCIEIQQLTYRSSEWRYVMVRSDAVLM